MKYRKIPVEIEAFILEKDTIKDVLEFMGTPVDNHSSSIQAEKWLDFERICHDRGGIVIKTLEGDMMASFGDYIIKGVKGEFYPCKPDVFKMTYEQVK